MSEPARELILNVDDTEVARYAKTRTLRHAGFDVIESATGALALELVAAAQPSLVLLDVRLPDISGIEICKTIKARWPATMVLQTSATFVTTADRVRGLEGGADSYLVQPIESDELVAAVRALLRLHAAEDAARRVNETLERRIAERTEELTRTNVALLEQIAQRERAEAALVQSQKMEAIGQLTGVMAHDFNNLLAALIGYLHLLRRKVGEGELRSLVERAMAAAERGGKLTARLLAFARTAALVNRVTDVHELVNGMHDWLSQSVGNAVSVRLSLAGDPLAMTDGNQLELAILNLVLNSRDAMHDGGEISIDVCARTLAEALPPEPDLKPGTYVVVTVSDTGHGMPPAVAARAFDPFYTTKPIGRGTGLGLSQVYSLARQSGGTARVDSTEGQGTRIELWLQSADAQAREAAAAEPADTVLGQGQRVLLVDDDADVLRTVSDMLEEAGYAVTTASNAVDALAALQAQAPHVLVVDYAMPGINGVELARQSRQLQPGLPVVFISGHAELDALKAAAAGEQLLRKPFRPAVLSAAIARSLSSNGTTLP